MDDKAQKKMRVVIADDEPITRMDLKEILGTEHYHVVGEAMDGFDAIELCKQLHPDLILLDMKMPLLDGLSAAHIIFDEDLADTVIMLTAYSEREFIDQAKEIGVSGYLVKPIDEKSLIPSIEVSVARSKEMKVLKKNMAKVSERMESRGIIEKAKGIIMKKQNISEQEAYDYIRNLSLTKNLSMRRVAELFLLRN